MQTIFPILAIIATVLASASLVLHKLAPKGKIPNEVLADIDAIKDALGTLGVKPLTAARKPQSGRVRFSLAALIASLGIGILALGCATLHTMTGAFATCASADLGALVKTEEGQLAPLAVAVAEAIEGNDAGLETWLEALGKIVGVDAIDCATVAYESAHPPTPAGSGEVAALIVQRPGLTRVQSWLVKQRSARK